MPDENVVTNLIVNGGQAFIRTHIDAADAQDKLTDAIRRASTVKTEILVDPIKDFVQAAQTATAESKKFKDELNKAFADENLPKRASAITRAIKEQTQALQENEAELKRVQKIQAENRTANLAEIPTTQPRNILGQFTAGIAVPGDTGAKLAAGSDAAITQSIERQRTAFLQGEILRREALEERAQQAQQLRAANRVAIEKAATEQILAQEAQRAARTETIRAFEAEKARVTNLATNEQARRQANSQDIFTAQNPQFNAKTASTLKVPVDTGLAAATNQQAQAFDNANTKGITYLSNLSAIHAASFLLTNRTFSTFGAISTLGLAMSKLAPAGTAASLGFGALGTAVGSSLAIINFFANSVSKVIELVESAGQKLIQFGQIAGIAGAAVVAASVKLASSGEDVLAEVAAFGEPTKAQFAAIEQGISNVARATGQSATAVGAGASLFIRAGGEIRDSINEDVAAVTKLVIASSKELIPAQAARSIVTVTNAFKEFGVTTDQAVNVIVGTAQKTALSFSEVTQAFQQAAPTAALLKIPVLDLATAIGVLANEGLKGQVAGTGLKQFLLDLLKPSEQAKTKLQELGISIQDQSGRIRPLRDIFADLKKALGDEADAFDKTGDASKAQALALIFGSRANLAAAIIARTGAEEFDKLKVAIAGVSADEVVNVLLSTTSAQAGILKTNIEELARAFGGPLNVGIGIALKSVNSFLQGIDRKPFELAGQAIIAIFTGGGFGQVKQALDSIENSKVREFLEGLVNSALTVRNAIVGNLIPAFQQAATNIGAALGTVDITEKFQGITGAIVGIINAGSRLVVFISELASDFITGNARGQEIRDTLGKIADVVKGALVAAFTAVIVPIIAGIATIELFGGALQKLVGIAAQFEKGIGQARVETFAAGAKLATDNLSNTSKQLDDVKTKIAALRAEQETLVGPRVANVDTELGLPSREAMDRAFQIRDQIAELAKQEAPLILAQQQLQAEANKANDALAREATAVGPFQQLQQEINNVKFDNITNFLEGDLPAGITNLANQLKTVQDAVNRGAGENDTTQAGFFPDPKKEQQIANQIADVVRTNTQETNDVIADSQTKELDLRRNTINRITDLDTAYHRNLRTLQDETDKKLIQSDRDFKERRQDRDDLKVIQRGFELESHLREQNNAQRDILIQQQDAADDKRNQRRVQDEDTVLSQIQNREERAEDIKNQIADRGFSQRQQNEETAFSRAQSKEEEAFSRQLQNIATARDNANRLAAAKTPQERSDLQKQITDTAANTRFSRQQEDQLTQFRQAEEDKRTKFQRSQEETAFQRQIKNEQAQFDFRVALEKKYIALRRELEDKETIRSNQTDFDRLLRRLGFSTEDFNFRIDQSERLEAAQDRLADSQHERENRRTIEDANLRRTELGQKLSEDLFGVFDDSNRQRISNEEQAQRQIRDINQRSARSLAQLIEREPTAATPAERAINQLNEELVITQGLLQLNTVQADRMFQVIRQAALEGEGVPTVAPTRSATFAIPEFNADTQRAIGAAQRIDISPVLMQFLPAAVVAGIQQAQIQGEGNRTVTIQGNTFNNDQMWRLIQQYLFNQR